MVRIAAGVASGSQAVKAIWVTRPRYSPHWAGAVPVAVVAVAYVKVSARQPRTRLAQDTPAGTGASIWVGRITSAPPTVTFSQDRLVVWLLPGVVTAVGLYTPAAEPVTRVKVTVLPSRSLSVKKSPALV